jgi:hypothetical protein
MIFRIQLYNKPVVVTLRAVTITKLEGKGITAFPSRMRVQGEKFVPLFWGQAILLLFLSVCIWLGSFLFVQRKCEADQSEKVLQIINVESQLLSRNL